MPPILALLLHLWTQGFSVRLGDPLTVASVYFVPVLEPSPLSIQHVKEGKKIPHPQWTLWREKKELYMSLKISDVGYIYEAMDMNSPKMGVSSGKR